MESTKILGRALEKKIKQIKNWERDIKRTKDKRPTCKRGKRAKDKRPKCGRQEGKKVASRC
jgi:hypothetical protein